MNTTPASFRRGARFCALAFVGSSMFAALSPPDEAAIRDRLGRYANQVMARDLAAIADIRTSNAVFMVPNEPAKKGTKDIIEWHKALPKLKTMTFDVVALDGNGDLAFLHGVYSFSFARPSQPDFKDAGKFIQVWRKQRDGSWKIERDIFNSDEPVATAATSSGPGIAGTYKLVSRKLPDGKMLHPPSVNGLFSITPTTMNFNIVTEDSPNKYSSYSAIGTYRLTPAELTMNDVFESMVNNGKVVNFDVAGRTTTTPVTITGRRVEFTPPTVKTPAGEIQGPHHAFDEKGLIATKPGEFVDTWEKISDAAPAAGHVTDALLEGTWELNVARSRFSPGPPFRSETRTYRLLPDGRHHATYDVVEADGKRVRSESTYSLDGKDSPISGDLNEDTQAISRTGPRTITAQIKKKGKVIRTATRELSEDGRTLTLHFKGVNAKGQPLDDTLVFERKAQEATTFR